MPCKLSSFSGQAGPAAPAGQWARHRALLNRQEVPVVPAPVLAQAWRGGNRQALPPRDRWLRGQQIVRQCFNSLANLKQADADGVEDQPVGQVATLQAERIASIAAWMSASR